MNYMTTKEVGEMLGVSQTTITYYIRNKLLNAVRVGKGYRITDEDLEEFIETRQTKKIERRIVK